MPSTKRQFLFLFPSLPLTISKISIKLYGSWCILKDTLKVQMLTGAGNPSDEVTQHCVTESVAEPSDGAVASKNESKPSDIQMMMKEAPKKPSFLGRDQAKRELHHEEMLTKHYKTFCEMSTIEKQ
jgi:hypothetical protein